MAGYFLTDDKRVKTQYDRLIRIPASVLPNLVQKCGCILKLIIFYFTRYLEITLLCFTMQITISGNGIKVPNAKFPPQRDKTR